MFPFSASCSSQSSVAVIQNQAENEDKRGAAEKGHDSVWSKSSSLLLHLPRLKLAAGIQKLVKGIRNLSNLFSIYKDDDDEMEMEIGCPTDVQHVAHIGWDGVNNVSVNGMKKLEERASGPFPLSSISLKQFELAMASQAQRSAAPFG